MLKLSQDQKKALNQLLDWYRKEKTVDTHITLGGYAGTGKTTLIAVFRKRLKEIDEKLKVSFVCYTGKASRVLRQKLKEEKAVFPKDTVGTIHSLIYTPIENDRQEIVGWKRKDKIDSQLIVIDEASMVDGLIWEHLLTYKIPIIAVGDHGQLPPIKNNFNLMEKPDLKLEEIHRQARENPIIALSIQARQDGIVLPNKYANRVRKFDKSDPEAQEAMAELLTNYDNNTLVLCGYNHTRRKLNNFIRQALGFESPSPLPNDRVICLRNNHTAGIFNGMLGTIVSIKLKTDKWYQVEINMDGEETNYEGLISVDQFGNDLPMNFTQRRREIMKGDLFDFGYALTVHKAQGGQAKKVILFEERFKQTTDDQWKRWLYTAVTRAEKELYIF
ncbi:MAG: AAA family ATPase [Patescibacteria group bacterium]